MKKLCILQNGLARGGTDTFVVNLCRGLDKSKFDITVVNPSNRAISVVREPDVLATGAKIFHTTPLTSFRGKLKHLIQLYSFLKKEKIDIIQTNIDLFNGPNLMVAWLAGVPLRCCHSHNGKQNKELDNGLTLPLKMYQKCMLWMCKVFSNRQCACSEDAMNFLYPDINWHAHNYPSIIFNGIDIERYSQITDEKQKKQELHLTNKYNILTIGHLIKQKNPLFTARLFVELCKKRNDIDLIWIGDGALKNEVMRILKKGDILDRVHFIGYRKDIDEVMHCADIFILPSNFEGLGIVAIEAQAAGLMCLLSDRVPKEADCGGVDFLPIDSGTEIWVTKINEIFNRKYLKKAQEDRLNKFSIEHMCDQMTKVFGS